MRIARLQRTDFGADLGGFLLKDRLWFFGAYDRVEFPAEISRYISSPLVPNTIAFRSMPTDNLYSGKLTWNIRGDSTLVATAFADPTTNHGAGRRRTPARGSSSSRVPPITNPDPVTWDSTRFIGGTDYGLRANQLLGSPGFCLFRARGTRTGTS